MNEYVSAVSDFVTNNKALTAIAALLCSSFGVNFLAWLIPDERLEAMGRAFWRGFARARLAKIGQAPVSGLADFVEHGVIVFVRGMVAESSAQQTSAPGAHPDKPV